MLYKFINLLINKIFIYNIFYLSIYVYWSNTRFLNLNGRECGREERVGMWSVGYGVRGEKKMKKNGEEEAESQIEKK